MSDVAKWALLVAGAIALIALIVSLPFVQFADGNEFTVLLQQLSTLAGSALQSARGIVNNFLTPFGRNVLTGLLYYLFGKWAISIGIKTGAWIYHFIFK